MKSMIMMMSRKISINEFNDTDDIPSSIEIQNSIENDVLNEFIEGEQVEFPEDFSDKYCNRKAIKRI